MCGYALYINNFALSFRNPEAKPGLGICGVCKQSFSIMLPYRRTAFVAVVVLLANFSDAMWAQSAGIDDRVVHRYSGKKPDERITGPGSDIATFYRVSVEQTATLKSFLQALGKNSIAYRGLNADSVFFYAEEMTRLSRLLHYPDGEHAGLHLTGYSYMIMGDFSRADSFTTLAIDCSRRAGKPQKEAASLEMRGAIARQLGQYDQALSAHRQSLAISQLLRDTMSEALALSNIAVALDSKGHYEEAVEAYFSALRVLEPSGDTAFIANTLLNIGALHQDNGHTEKALEYTEKALALHRATGNAEGIVKCLINLAEAQRRGGRNDLCEAALREGEQLAEAMSDPYGLANVYAGWISLLSAQRRFEEALRYIDKQQPLLVEIQALPELTESLLTKGRVMADLGRTPMALPAAESALVLADSMGSLRHSQQAMALLSEVWEQLGQPAQALKFLQKATELKDSIQGIDVQAKISELEIRYQTEKREATIRQQRSALAHQRLGMGFIALLLLAIAAIGYVQYRRNIQKREINRLLEQQNEQLRAANSDLETRLRTTTHPSRQPEDIANLTITLPGQDKKVLRLGDIVYIQADGNTVDIFTQDGRKYADWQRLKSYWDLLEPTGLFVQAHRSFLVNYLHIQSRRANELRLSNGVTVPIGKTVKAVVNSWLDQRLNTVDSKMSAS